MTADRPDTLPIYRRSLVVVAVSQAFGAGA
jgi:hypothetical protein